MGNDRQHRFARFGQPGHRDRRHRRDGRRRHNQAARPLAATSGRLPGEHPLHRRDGVIVLELERAPAARLSAAHLLGEMQAIGAALAAAPDLPRTCQAAVRELRRLTGFDRVMVYRFLEDGSGCVLAEDRAAELPPFLNHHYPASDIPRQARELYLRNVIRVVPDVGYMPSPLEPPVCPATGRPLDMSDCALRSVSFTTPGSGGSGNCGNGTPTCASADAAAPPANRTIQALRNRFMRALLGGAAAVRC